MSVTTINHTLTISIKDPADLAVDISTKLEHNSPKASFKEYTILPPKKRYGTFFSIIKKEIAIETPTQKIRQKKEVKNVNCSAVLALQAEEIKKEFDKAVGYDTLRAAAKTIETREYYRTLALEGYKKIASKPGKSSAFFVESYFRSAYLADLNKKGEFAPQNMKKSYELYSQAAKLDEKNYVIQNILGLHYFVSHKNMVNTRFFEKAEELKSSLASKIIKLESGKQTAKVAHYCKKPDELYFEKIGTKSIKK